MIGPVVVSVGSVALPILTGLWLTPRDNRTRMIPWRSTRSNHSASARFENLLPESEPLPIDAGS